jgi:carbon monoxide dehydrogenase subunit G
MEITNGFDVAAPPDEVFAFLLDPERVAPCMPGAELIGRREDGAYDAKMTIKLGLVSMGYQGVMEIRDVDAEARRASMVVRGKEGRGQGTAEATMTMKVTPAGAGSHVDVASDIAVTGKVAQMGAPIMKKVAEKMTAQLAANMQKALAG